LISAPAQRSLCWEVATKGRIEDPKPGLLSHLTTTIHRKKGKHNGKRKKKKKKKKEKRKKKKRKESQEEISMLN